MLEEKHISKSPQHFRTVIICSLNNFNYIFSLLNHKENMDVE